MARVPTRVHRCIPHGLHCEGQVAESHDLTRQVGPQCVIAAVESVGQLVLQLGVGVSWELGMFDVGGRLASWTIFKRQVSCNHAGT